MTLGGVMGLWRGIEQRRREPEEMDRPGLEAARLDRALAGLARINFLSGSARILWHPILDYARRHQLKTITILDLACGSGDLTLALWRRGYHAGLALNLEAWDQNPRALAYGRSRARRAKAPILFKQRDVLRESIPPIHDIITCSLFLHHLSEVEAVHLLGRMARATRGLLLINDLKRSRTGLLLAYVGPRLLTSSDVVHSDAVKSVRAAFTPAEVRALARQAGLYNVSITSHWPMRYLLSWERME